MTTKKDAARSIDEAGAIRPADEKEVAYPIGDTTMDDVAEDRRPILHALDVVGQKWKLPILWYLHEAQATRYNELKRRMPGITNTMLTKSLRELEGAGLMSRHSYGTVPPRVDYSLTDSGRELLPTLNELHRWGEAHMRSASGHAPESSLESPRSPRHGVRGAAMRTYACGTASPTNTRREQS